MKNRQAALIFILVTVTLDEALALFAQPKQRRGRQQKPAIAELVASTLAGGAPDFPALEVEVLDYWSRDTVD